MTTLIFPATVPAAIEYFEAAQLRGESVLAAASVVDATSKAAFEEVIPLPYVYDDRFHAQFLELVQTHRITQVYAPVASVHAFLKNFLERENIPVRMSSVSPITAQLEAYRKLLHKADKIQAFIECCAAPAPEATLTQLDIAAILRYAGLIYGESSEEKIAAMMAIFASAPKGDVIEIGSLMGKSVFVLHYLARHYHIGNVLSVDPLSSAAAVQHDSPEAALGVTHGQWDFALVRDAIAVNLLPVSGGQFNYLRMESEHGFDAYRASHTISSPPFGEVTYRGEIAVIHIDGNHDFAQVDLDCKLWLPLLAPGAWLILDDYLWSHGDGPYRVGNRLLEERSADIARAFVCGKALFVKFK